MLKRENLAIAKIAGGKYPWLLVSDNFTMATDGKVIAFTKRPKLENPPTWVGPTIRALQKQGRFLIPIEKAKELLKSFSKKRIGAYSENIFLLEPRNGHRRLLINGEEQAFEDYNAHIPNYKKIWPRGRTKFSICLSIDTLLGVLKMLKEANARSTAIKFEFYADDGPAKFKCRSDDNQEIIGLIMPVKIKI